MLIKKTTEIECQDNKMKGYKKLKSSKRAQREKGIGVLMAVIIFLVLAALYFGVFGIMSNWFNKTNWSDICKASILKRRATSIEGVTEPLADNQRLSCPTRYIQIKEDGIYTFIKDEFKRTFKYQEDGISDREEAIQFNIADEMATWARTLKISPFGHFTDEFKCMILAEISIKEDIGIAGAQIDDFHKFLNTHYVKTTDYEDRPTYSEYIYGADLDDSNAMSLAPGKEYTMIYVIYRNSFLLNTARFSTVGYLLGGPMVGLAGAVGGAVKHSVQEEVTPHIELWESTSTELQRCERLY